MFLPGEGYRFRKQLTDTVYDEVLELLPPKSETIGVDRKYFKPVYYEWTKWEPLKESLTDIAALLAKRHFSAKGSFYIAIGNKEYFDSPEVTGIKISKYSIRGGKFKPSKAKVKASRIVNRRQKIH